jgi:glycosyltransferase involved in cell wall biosynthesis
LIGLNLKERFPDLRWFADFRDPWSAWGLLDSLKVSKWIRVLHRKLEARVLSAADEVITITPFYVRHFEQISNRPVRLLTNGYDEADFKSINHQQTEKFVIRHVGIVNEKCDPRPFLHALETAIKNDSDFAKDVKLEFIGQVHGRIESFVLERDHLKRVTSFVGNIPHELLLKMYGSSSLLLLVLTGYKDAEGYLPGKLFEYLATGLPVMGIGPLTGDAASVLQESGAGHMLEAEDENSIIRELMHQYKRWKSHGSLQVRQVDRSQFSRREITGHLVQMLNEKSAMIK